VSDWGPSTYGNPCRECGFDWTVSRGEVVALVADVPVSWASVLAGATGDERYPDVPWSVTEYVCHVGDNLRIWAERLMGVTDEGPLLVASYDENRLAEVRAYRSVPLRSATWSLGGAVKDWLGAVGQSRPGDAVLIHPDRGALTLDDVVLSNGHDALHHRWDIERAIGWSRSGA
jgi:hypothetical protein